MTRKVRKIGIMCLLITIIVLALVFPSLYVPGQWKKHFPITLGPVDGARCYIFIRNVFTIPYTAFFDKGGGGYGPSGPSHISSDFTFVESEYVLNAGDTSAAIEQLKQVSRSLQAKGDWEEFVGRVYAQIDVNSLLKTGEIMLYHRMFAKRGSDGAEGCELYVIVLKKGEHFRLRVVVHRWF